MHVLYFISRKSKKLLTYHAFPSLTVEKLLFFGPPCMFALCPSYHVVSNWLCSQLSISWSKCKQWKL